MARLQRPRTAMHVSDCMALGEATTTSLFYIMPGKCPLFNYTGMVLYMLDNKKQKKVIYDCSKFEFVHLYDLKLLFMYTEYLS
jgi:hypothetical protein